MPQNHSTAAENCPQPARSGYGFLASILDGLDDDGLVAALEVERPYRDAGRRGYGVRALWRAWLCKYILRIDYNVELVERLESSSKLRAICGLEEAPSPPTICRFFKRLMAFQPLVEQVLVSITEQIGLQLPNFGEVLATDATVFETFGNPDRKTVGGDPSGDMDARWGYKNSAKTKDKEGIEWCFGYKMHAVADATYGIPLGFILTSANKNESPIMRDVVQKIQSDHKWLQPKFLVADKGYDAVENARFLMDRQITPVIHLRKPTNEKLHHGIYTDEGSPTCQGEREMSYVRTDPSSGHHLFRCPADGCKLKSKRSVHYCADEIWEDPEAEPRFVGVLPRATPAWKKLYKMRWSIERLFSSLKRSRNLDLHCFREMRKVLLHATLSTLTYSATALARLNARDERRMRIMRVNAS